MYDIHVLGLSLEMAKRSLKDRVIYGHGVGGAAGSAERSSSRPSKYKLWDETKMTQALSIVTKGGISVREADLQVCPSPLG